MAPRASHKRVAWKEAIQLDAKKNVLSYVLVLVWARERLNLLLFAAVPSRSRRVTENSVCLLSFPGAARHAISPLSSVQLSSIFAALATTCHSMYSWCQVCAVSVILAMFRVSGLCIPLHTRVQVCMFAQCIPLHTRAQSCMFAQCMPLHTCA